MLHPSGYIPPNLKLTLCLSILTCLNPRKFFFGGYVTFFVQVPKSLSKPPFSICPEQSHIDERSNPTSQPSYAAINIMNCCVGALLFGSLDFLIVILLWTRTHKVQEISQKLTRSKCPPLDRLDYGSNSTIQLTPFTTNNMKIAIGRLLLGLFDFSTRQGGWTTHQFF